MQIRVTNPKGMAPSIRPEVLADSMAQSAVNCVLGMGAVEPLRGPSVVGAPTKGGTIKGIYPFANKWFNWISDVDVCRSPIANDQWGRIYFAGGATFAPQYTVPGAATGGIDYPSVSYQLGVPAPAVAATVAATGVITDPDPTLVETRFYVYTYVSAYGEEGPPCAPSPAVDVAPGQSVQVSGLQGAPAGAFNITLKRIYRTNTGSGGTDYQLVATVPVATTSFADTVESVSLGSVLASVSWVGPPADLHSLIALPGGALAGLSGNELCFSEPYMPHAWPTEYRLSFDGKGVALGAFGNNILVVTDGVPYLVAGSHPSAMTPERLEEGYACVSKRGMVDMGYALIYPAVNGLMLVGMGAVKLLTQGMINQRDWSALNPASIHAYLWDKKYVAFWQNGTGTEGFIFDPTTGDLTYHSIAATAGYHDPATGVLYLVSGGNIVTWSTGDELTAAWRSKRFVLPYALTMACAQVLAQGYPVTAKFYAGGVLRHTRVVLGPDPFRLPGGYRARDYEVEVSGERGWTMLALATSRQELATI